MGKHVPLPIDPKERTLEIRRRHRRCVAAYKRKRAIRLREQIANHRNRDLVDNVCRMDYSEIIPTTQE